MREMAWKAIPRHHVRNDAGFGLIGWLVLVPVGLVALLVLIFGVYEGRKAYWDSEVRGMCAKDGGIRIYERVSVTQAEYERLGGREGMIPVPRQQNLIKNFPVVTIRNESVINERAPRAYKVENQYVRMADQKIVAVSIRYFRVGGDFPSHAHPSSFMCPDQKQAVQDEKAIFLIGDRK